MSILNSIQGTLVGSEVSLALKTISYSFRRLVIQRKNKIAFTEEFAEMELAFIQERAKFEKNNQYMNIN